MYSRYVFNNDFEKFQFPPKICILNLGQIYFKIMSEPLF